MKVLTQAVLLFFTILTLLSTIGRAQVPVSQAQYFVEKGALKNPEFEQGYAGWTITGCSKSLVTETPYLNKSLKLTCVGETFSIKQEVTSLVPFATQSGAYGLQIKSSASGVKVSSLTNSVKDSEIAIIGDSKFKNIKQIPFVVGSTSNGIEVYADSVFTGEVIIDNVSFGISNSVFSQIYTEYLLNINGTIPSSYTANTPIIVSGVTTNYFNMYNASTGEITAPQDGVYKLDWFFDTDSASNSYTKIYVDGVDTGIRGISYSAIGLLVGSGSVYANTGQKITVRSSNPWSAVGGSNRISVAFTKYDGNVVSQQTELTAKTANFFSAYMNGGGVISGDSYDFINGNCSVIGNSWRCNLNDLSISTGMHCQAQVVGADTPSGAQVFYNMYGSNTAYIEFNSTIAGVGSNSQAIYIQCHKADQDLNKSQTIFGKVVNRKCQNKYLVNTQISAGTMSDMTYNNLVIGKLYSFSYTQTGYSTSSGVYNGATLLQNAISGSGNTMAFTLAGLFTATSTTVTVNKQDGSGEVRGLDGSDRRTNLTICEENGTVLTTDFN